ncbi:MAG TPA: sulfur carrier protein ThiS [Pseudomonadales bacterium]|nr:sulfur carrier protein ThiS [Pseudomonadales bacterium]
MSFQLNGESKQIESGKTLTDLVALLGLTGKRIAIEVNEEIIPRGEHASTQIQPGDKIEIVNAIGGG